MATHASNHLSRFGRLAKWASTTTGHAGTFVLAATVIVLWGLTGPLFGFSDTWQLVINTATTIVTFLMVFLIQNTQNRDTIAMQVKLDEIIRVVAGAHSRLLDLEEMDEKELEEIRRSYERLADRARRDEAGDLGQPEVAVSETGASR